MDNHTQRSHRAPCCRAGDQVVRARPPDLRWTVKRLAADRCAAPGDAQGCAAGSNRRDDARATADATGTSEQILAATHRAYIQLLLDGREATPEGVELNATLASLRKERDLERRTETAGSQPGSGFLLAKPEMCDLKVDLASMQAPIFSLSSKVDMSVTRWKSGDGRQSLEVCPSVKGRATQHDKDVLIYCISQMIDALNRKCLASGHRTVRFPAHRFLAATKRGRSKDEYARLQEALERLAGTRITTDIATGSRRIRGGFGLIDRWRIVEKDNGTTRMAAVEVTLSEWLWNAVESIEVLTLDPRYFDLRKALAKRLYEIARKHCGRQRTWRIGLELLRTKAGSRASLSEFKRMVKAVIKDDNVPEYSFELVERASLADCQVVFVKTQRCRTAKA